MPFIPFPCCNLRALKGARLLGFSLFGAMLFSDHVRPVIEIAPCESVDAHISDPPEKRDADVIGAFNFKPTRHATRETFATHTNNTYDATTPIYTS